MKNTNKTAIFFISLLIILLIIDCKKNTLDNPYDNYITPKLYEEPTLAELPTSNFGYLYSKIFKPTCANSGCHDGAFEPDFRTIESAYNSTVYHPVLTNNSTGTFVYRIKPGDAINSLLHERLLVALPSTSGIMPLVYEDDWSSNKTSYINYIKEWINAGAMDMYGNSPTIGNPNPIVTGMNVYDNNTTTTPKSRAAGAGINPILIPRSNLDIWFSIKDDATVSTNLSVNQVKISTEMSDFKTISPQSLSVSSGFTANNFAGNPVNFTHKLDFNASIYPANILLFIRVYVQDDDHNSPIENPSEGSSKQATYLFTLYTI